MTTSASRTQPKSLVDMEKGLISREIFVNEEIYQQELEQIFARAWLLVGHESQIPKPGDYMVSSMGEESVIMARDRQGAIHVFLNSCRHRGMKVCRYDEGNTPVFTCPYHGWSYALDGKLVGVPYFKDAYHSELKKEEWGLAEVPQMTNYRGWIWATWDEDAPPFLEYLGGMKYYFDLITDHPSGSEGGAELYVGVQKWRMPSNWKFAAENFIGDFYHNVSHRSVDLVGISPSGKKGRHTEGDIPTPHVVVNYADAAQGHGHGGFMYLVDDPPYAPAFGAAPPIVEEYFRKAWEERKRRDPESARFRGGVGTVFPNASMSVLRTIAVWHPRGPQLTEAWRFYFIPADAPQEVVDTIRHYNLRYAGPGGLTEQDDMENWNYASAASRGTIARRYPYNYQMGLEHESPESPRPWLPGKGKFTLGISEQNQRNFYKRWSEYMEARSWADLLPR